MDKSFFHRFHQERLIHALHGQNRHFMGGDRHTEKRELGPNQYELNYIDHFIKGD